MQFLDRLPEEADSDAKYTILAPDGGYGVNIEMEALNEVSFIDVLAQRDDRRFLIRVYPVREQITTDSKRPGVFSFMGSFGQFLDYDGRETGRYVKVFVYINTLVTQDGMPAGELRMWDQFNIDDNNLTAS